MPITSSLLTLDPWPLELPVQNFFSAVAKGVIMPGMRALLGLITSKITTVICGLTLQAEGRVIANIRGM